MTCIASSNILRLSSSAATWSGLSKLPIFVPERLGLPRDGAAAHAEDAAPARDVVQVAKSSASLSGCHWGTMLNAMPIRMRSRPLGEDRADQQPVRDDLVPLVLEVVLGQPERVEAEPIAQHAHVEDLLGRPPHLLLVVPAIGRRRCAGTGVRHLDATEEEDSRAHGATVRN